MWIVPSRQRPHKLRRFLAACAATKTQTRIVVVIDETEPCTSEYHATGAEILVRPGESIGCVDKVRFAFRAFPDLQWYGMLVDDCEPLTRGWDVALIEACMPGRIAYCDDGRGRYCMPAICGTLLRAVGDVGPAGLQHYGLDQYWRKLARASGRLVYLRRHTIRLTDRVRGEPESSWDEPKRRQKARRHEDKAVWHAMRKSQAFRDMVATVQAVPCHV
jgi:hypothetical protein